MRTLKITEAVGHAWSHFERRGWYLFGLTAAVMAVSMFAVNDAIVTALSSILMCGYVVVLLKHARHEPYSFDDLFVVDQRWVYFAFGTLIKILLIFIGLVFLVVPGVYLAIRWMFSGLFIIDKGMRPLEALKASSELTAGYRWTLFGYALLATLILLISLCLFVVGVFAAVAVLNLATIMLFWKLQELQYQNQNQS